MIRVPLPIIPTYFEIIFPRNSVTLGLINSNNFSMETFQSMQNQFFIVFRMSITFTRIQTLQRMQNLFKMLFFKKKHIFMQFFPSRSYLVLLIFVEEHSNETFQCDICVKIKSVLIFQKLQNLSISLHFQKLFIAAKGWVDHTKFQNDSNLGWNHWVLTCTNLFLRILKLTIRGFQWVLFFEFKNQSQLSSQW